MTSWHNFELSGKLKHYSNLIGKDRLMQKCFQEVQEDSDWLFTFWQHLLTLKKQTMLVMVSWLINFMAHE